MPSLVKIRSYYDSHEKIEGGMFPFDVAHTFGDAIGNLPNTAMAVGRLVTAPIRGVVNTAYLANEARHGLNNAVEHFSGEQHAREGNRPNGKSYGFLGPHTNLTKRLDSITHKPKPEFQPINSIDTAAMRHDLQYDQIADDYRRNPTPQNKKHQIKRIHDEDDIFIDKVKRHRDDDPRIADLASAAISAKKLCEKLGVLDTLKYSGFGKKPRINIIDETDEANDPVFRLRKIAMKQNRNYETPQKGGFIIPPFIIPILAAAGSTLVGKIYDTIKEKIINKKTKEGQGFKLSHKTIKQKRKFLIDLSKHL
jgi:hypothetical protein